MLGAYRTKLNTVNHLVGWYQYSSNNVLSSQFNTEYGRVLFCMDAGASQAEQWRTETPLNVVVHWLVCICTPYQVQRNYDGFPGPPVLFALPPTTLNLPNPQATDFPLQPQLFNNNNNNTSTTTSHRESLVFSTPIFRLYCLRSSETLEPLREPDHVYPLKTFHLATPWLGRHLRLEIISSFDTSRPTSPGSSAPSSRSVPLARGPVLNLSTPPPIRTIAVSSGCRPTQGSRHPPCLSKNPLDAIAPPAQRESCRPSRATPTRRLRRPLQRPILLARSTLRTASRMTKAPLETPFC